MATNVEIKEIDVEAELKAYDDAQAEKARIQAEKDKADREAKIAELQRKAKINEELKNIVQEENVSIIADTLNTLLPFITQNLEYADLSLVNELVKKASKKTGDSKSSNKNSGATYLILDGKKMQSDKPDLYSSLITKTGVDYLKENKDYLVVTKKNYGAKFTKLVIENGFKAIPKEKGKPEVSATAVALNTYTLRSKEVDKNEVSFDDALAKELSFFEEVSE